MDTMVAKYWPISAVLATDFRKNLQFYVILKQLSFKYKALQLYYYSTEYYTTVLTCWFGPYLYLMLKFGCHSLLHFERATICIQLSLLVMMLIIIMHVYCHRHFKFVFVHVYVFVYVYLFTNTFWCLQKKNSTTSIILYIKTLLHM